MNANDAEDAEPSTVTGRGEAAVPPNTPDPVEIAMAQVNAGAPPDSPASVLLFKQSRLIDADMRYRHLQIAGERMSVVLRVLTVVVGLGLAVGVGAFVANASSASGLVIEPFSVPPDMARNGITGEVVASQLLDRLVRLDAQTVSIRAPSTYDNDWRGNVKVEIPQIGISLGELNRYLRVWLGNETGQKGSGSFFCSLAVVGDDASRLAAYRQLFANASIDGLRLHTQQQKPRGSERFRQQIEILMQRSMQVRPRGRPKSDPEK